MRATRMTLYMLITMRGPFLERSVAFPARKAVSCLPSLHSDQSFKNFYNDTMKLSINEAKLTSLRARKLCYYSTGFELKFCVPDLSRNESQVGKKSLLVGLVGYILSPSGVTSVTVLHFLLCFITPQI